MVHGSFFHCRHSQDELEQHAAEQRTKIEEEQRRAREVAEKAEEMLRVGQATLDGAVMYGSTCRYNLERIHNS
jgi:hypothetical protein